MLPHNGTEKLASVIAREIVKDLVRQNLEPGANLPAESVMLERFGVGRASLREALRILEVHGLITIRPGPGGGPIVQTVSSRHFGQMATLYLHVAGATFRDLVAARFALEPLMARWSATRQDPEMLAQFKQWADPKLDVDNPEQQFATGIEFHALIAGASGNAVLDLMGRGIASIYAERITGVIFPAEAREQVVREHAEIAQAIIRGEAELAERLMHAHMTEYVKQVEARYPGFLDERVDWK